MYSGFSWTTFDDLTLHLLQAINPRRILDIGAGEGKYGRLIRAGGNHSWHVTAVEFEAGRRDELLAIGYNEVRSISALDLMQHSSEDFEVIILGDVIEHFRKSEGQDLLEFLNYRAAYLFVVTPENMPMSSPRFYEGHNSIWRPESMRWHDLWAHCRNGQMHFYLLRGLLAGGGLPLADLVNDANDQTFMQMVTSPNQNGQPRQLTLHDGRSSDIDTDAGVIWTYRPN